jgi:hypothetical protein
MPATHESDLRTTGRVGSGVVPSEAPASAALYELWEGQLIFDAPVADVWRCVIEYPAWQDYSMVKHISGEPGEEGELVLLKKEEPGLESFPPFYARTIKLIPDTRVIWKTFPAEASDELDFFGIVDFGVAPASDGSRFTYSLLYEFLVPYQSEVDLENFRSAQREQTEAMLASILPKLRRLVGRRLTGKAGGDAS